MPGISKPIVGGMGPTWTAVFAAIQGNAQQTRQLNAGSTQGTVVDAYGNTSEVYGSNLLATVTIGAAFQQPGVLVTTGFAASPAASGRAEQKNLVTGTINATAGTNSVTIASGLSGLAVGQMIGAADVTDPSSGTPTPAIVPGSVVASISGSTVNLTPPSGVTNAVAESGTGLYAAACNFTKL